MDASTPHPVHPHPVPPHPVHPHPGHPDERGPVLITLAREAIAAGLPGSRSNSGWGPALEPDAGPAQEPEAAAPAWLREYGACFVTLHLLDTTAGARVASTAPKRRLRGCIGTIEAYRSLLEDVRGNAEAAAFHDPRFSPVSPADYAHLHVEVSVLSQPEPLPYRDHADLARQLQPGIDGLVLEYAGRRGTYLPQVWEQIPDPGDFLASLVMKAHLPRGFWSDDIALMRYTVTSYAEPLQEAT